MRETIKFYCMEWYPQKDKKFPAWWKNNEYVELDLFQVMDLYFLGFNLMLAHQEDGAIGLYIDDKLFYQR